MSNSYSSGSSGSTENQNFERQADQQEHGYDPNNPQNIPSTSDSISSSATNFITGVLNKQSNSFHNDTNNSSKKRKYQDESNTSTHSMSKKRNTHYSDEDDSGNKSKSFKPKSNWNQDGSVTMARKYFIQQEEYPKYNVVGRLLGPKGRILKSMEQKSGCTIQIRGVASDNRKYNHYADQPLHVFVSAVGVDEKDAEAKLDAAENLIDPILHPKNNRHNDEVHSEEFGEFPYPDEPMHPNALYPPNYSAAPSISSFIPPYYAYAVSPNPMVTYDNTKLFDYANYTVKPEQSTLPPPPTTDYQPKEETKALDNTSSVKQEVSPPRTTSTKQTPPIQPTTTTKPTESNMEKKVLADWIKAGVELPPALFSKYLDYIKKPVGEKVSLMQYLIITPVTRDDLEHLSKMIAEQS